MTTSTIEDLVIAADGLSSPDLDRLVERVIALRARRRAPRAPRDEARLLETINRDLPHADRERLDVLVARRQDETLTAPELAELTRLTDQAASLTVERTAALVQLAALRGVTVRQLMDDLGATTPTGA